jgi:choline dehydrogenase-like flavoprotein
MQSSILPKDHRAPGNAIRLNNDTHMEALRAPSFAAGASWKRKQLEIILCAGATGSPQILMLSGVGPGTALSQLGISLVADPPGVGLNLQDHLAVGVTFECKQPVYSSSSK